MTYPHEYSSTVAVARFSLEHCGPRSCTPWYAQALLLNLATRSRASLGLKHFLPARGEKCPRGP
jgi:hypothetical protein